MEELTSKDIRDTLNKMKEIGTLISEYKYCLVVGTKVYWSKSWTEVQSMLRKDNEL